MFMNTEVTIAFAIHKLIYYNIWQNILDFSCEANMTKMCATCLTQHKDRIDFYSCIIDAPFDASDHTCHKDNLKIFMQKPINAWYCSHLHPYCELNLTCKTRGYATVLKCNYHER